MIPTSQAIIYPLWILLARFVVEKYGLYDCCITYRDPRLHTPLHLTPTPTTRKCKTRKSIYTPTSEVSLTPSWPLFNSHVCCLAALVITHCFVGAPTDPTVQALCNISFIIPYQHKIRYIRLCLTFWSKSLYVVVAADDVRVWARVQPPSPEALGAAVLSENLPDQVNMLPRILHQEISSYNCDQRGVVVICGSQNRRCGSH